jgi:hypothetical protein
MHPTIGDLISSTYYDNSLVNRTLDEKGIPLSRVRHPFDLPDGVGEKAIVWVDVPWAARQQEWAEVGPCHGTPALHKSQRGGSFNTTVS